jgi:hypothetical protein
VVLRLIGDGEPTRLQLGAEFRVDGSAALLSELRRLFGRGSVRLVNGDAEEGQNAPASPVGVR